MLLFKRSFLLILYFPGGGAVPRLELPGGATGLLPPRYATVPGLRKGNASRCNIKRASLMGAPSQPLRGGTHRGGRGGPAPPRTPWIGLTSTKTFRFKKKWGSSFCFYFKIIFALNGVHNYIIVLTLINAFEYTIEYFQWKFSKTYLNSP